MIHDITPPIDAELQVWPGDTPPSREVVLDMARGASVTLSTLHATVHLGAHADAPCHYGLGAPGIDARPLDDYLGPCQVIAVQVERGGRFGPGDVGVAIEAPRVLFRTGTYPDPSRFHVDFAAMAPALVGWLHARGVRLVGIDTPSVDLYDAHDLPTHREFLAHDMAILEGLDLSSVPEGRYELIALPLRLVGFDASPVRAVLRTIEDGTDRHALDSTRFDVPETPPCGEV
jgi:arylformamidase